MTVNIAKSVVNQYSSLSPAELLNAPVDALRGLSEADARALRSINVRTIGDLANNRFVRAAQELAAPSLEIAQFAPMTNRLSAAAARAEAIFATASELGARRSLLRSSAAIGGLVGDASARSAATASEASPNDLNALLNSVSEAPGSSTIVTVPNEPVSGDFQLVQNVQLVDALIATLTALVMYDGHPEPYDLSDSKDAARFVIDLANARNFIVSGGEIKAIPQYLSLNRASTQSVSKSVTSATLHLELLTELFGALDLTESVIAEIDVILTNFAELLRNLELSFETDTQTLNHFVSFYRLSPIAGTTINEMLVDFIYLQIDQKSWLASAGKASAANFEFKMTMTRTTARLNAGIVAANAADILNSLDALTENDATRISELTGTKGVTV